MVEAIMSKQDTVTMPREVYEMLLERIRELEANQRTQPYVIPLPYPSAPTFEVTCDPFTTECLEIEAVVD